MTRDDSSSARLGPGTGVRKAGSPRPSSGSSTSRRKRVAGGWSAPVSARSFATTRSRIKPARVSSRSAVCWTRRRPARRGVSDLRATFADVLATADPVSYEHDVDLESRICRGCDFVAGGACDHRNPCVGPRRATRALRRLRAAGGSHRRPHGPTVKGRPYRSDQTISAISLRPRGLGSKPSSW